MKKYILLFLLTLNQITAFSQAPSFRWAKAFSGGCNDIAYSITTDSRGNVYTTGFFDFTGDFDPGIGVYPLTSAGSDEIFISKLDSSGNFLWAKRIGGIGSDGGSDIFVDSLCNVYLTGSFRDTCDFDPGVGTYTLGTAGGSDVFVCKLDSSGNFVWAKSFGGIQDENGYSITVDNLGNVYTTGFYRGTADFDPGVGVFNQTITGAEDIFISKLNSYGSFIWAKSIGGRYGDYGNSISCDGLNNIYITGNFLDTVDFNPGIGINNLIGTGAPDVFVNKLDASGNFVWVKKIGGSGAITIGNSVVDKSGNVFTTGWFLGVVDFDPGPVVNNLAPIAGQDIFVSKLDASGNFVWAKSMGGTSGETGNSIAIDDSSNVYTTGIFNGTCDFDPSIGIDTISSFGGNVNNDVFISKLDAAGNFIWAKSFEGRNDGKGHSICVDGPGNIYITGGFADTVDFDPGVPVYNITATFLMDVFITKLKNEVRSYSGISENGSGIVKNIKVYPNPNSGIFKLKFQNDIHNAEIVLYNAIGQEVYRQPVSSHEEKIITNGLAEGLYNYIILEEKQIIHSGKVVIE